MSEEKRNTGTNPDFRPQRGQESNENRDQVNRESNEENQGEKSDARSIEEQTNTSGAGSSQRRNPDNAAGNVGPLDADLEQLPSQKRRDRGSNLTGPGLG